MTSSFLRKNWKFLGILLIMIKFCCSTFCEDGSKCVGEKSTCCKGIDKYFCCPYENAICCPDLLHCCPQGSRCNLDMKKCEQLSQTLEPTGEFKEFEELLPTSLIYKKGWNYLYENCADDLKLLKDDFWEIVKSFFEGKIDSYDNAKNLFLKLLNDEKIMNEDCIKFLKEVFD